LAIFFDFGKEEPDRGEGVSGTYSPGEALGGAPLFPFPLLAVMGMGDKALDAIALERGG
jgi:hypothetical protein